jgi:hypothetical protein
MHVYLDESGTFAIPQSGGGVSFSTMGALAIPTCYQRAIWKRYRRLRTQLPREADEVKGRLLNESQVASVVNLLVKSPLLFNVLAIDMAAQTTEAVVAHRAGQAQTLLLSVGPDHRPSLIAQMQQLSQRLRGTPPQLYTQSVLIFELVLKAIQHAILLYSQILPKELGEFIWVFDAKDKQRLTDWEQWWKLMIAPMLQSIALRVPIIGLAEGDYSYFDHVFQIETSEWFNKATGNREQFGTSLGLILKEFRFDAGVNYGLEMVDILTNAIRRALTGNLGEMGWDNISKLIPKLRDRHRVHLVSFVEPTANSNLPYAGVIRKLDRYSRPLLVD